MNLPTHSPEQQSKALRMIFCKIGFKTTMMLSEIIGLSYRSYRWER
jgi:hypothetical protein